MQQQLEALLNWTDSAPRLETENKKLVDFLRENAGADVGSCQFMLILIPNFMIGVFPLLEAWDKGRLQDSQPEEAELHWG